MKRKLYILFVVIAAGAIIFSSTAIAATGTMKSIKAYFTGIKIFVDGKQQAATPEPFIYNNVTYVPIRLVSTALGASVAWDTSKNAVVINSKSATNQDLQKQISSLQSQLSQKDSQIAQLTQQNAYLQNRVVDLEASLKEEEASHPAEDLEDYLYDEYSKWKSMEFDYNVDGDEDDLELTIEIDLSDYSNKWYSTDQDDIENWLNDIYDYVEDEYPDADFSGTIEDIDEDETLVKFESSGSDLDVDFRYSEVDFGELEDDLNGMYGDNLDDYNGDFGDMTADISVDGDEGDEEIFITVEIDTDDYGDEWESVKETDDAEAWIEDMVDYTMDYYDDYDVSGEIVNQDDDTMASFYVNSSGEVDIDWDYSY